MTHTTPTWYVMRRDDGRCDILPHNRIPEPKPDLSPSAKEEKRIWGPFATPASAIAHRVGLIRAGKCKPI